MKCIQAAYICQTLHFVLKEELPHPYAAELVRKEVLQYKKVWKTPYPAQDR